MQRLAQQRGVRAPRPKLRPALLRDQRGLSSLEYALLFVIVCIGALVVWHTLGRDMRCQLELAISHFYEALGGTPNGQPSACAGTNNGGGNGILPPKSEARQLAEALVRSAGNANASDREAVIREVEKLPVGGLKALQAKGISITVVHDSVVEALPNLKGVRPRGWPPGTGWDTVPGTYDPNTHQVVIATRNGAVPATGNGHGSADLVAHETCHAFDDAVSGHSDPNFQAARNQDLAKLPAYETQPGDAGLQETYAESFAQYQSNPTALKNSQPNLYKYWDSHPLDKH